MVQTCDDDGNDAEKAIPDSPNLHSVLVDPEMDFRDNQQPSNRPTKEQFTQFLQNEAENPDIAPHTCFHCSQICLDLRFRTAWHKRVDFIDIDGGAFLDGDCPFFKMIWGKQVDAFEKKKKNQIRSALAWRRTSHEV